MKTIFSCALLLTLVAPVLVFAQVPTPDEIIPRGDIGGFDAVTGIPVFESAENTVGVDITSFFNQLYVLSVGAAAIVAVAQIMLAGFQLATAQGSYGAIGEARSKIQNSILGLLLVLSPTIVFGIINPDILNLDIDVSRLTDRPEVNDVPVSPSQPSGPGQTNQVSGAYDDVCDLKNAPLGPGFNLGVNVSLKDLGEGSENQGRSCCRLLDGSITEKNGNKEASCSLESLLKNDRWSVIIDTKSTTGDPGKEERYTQDVVFRSVGAHIERPVWDIDMIAIHGFRSKSACESFVTSVRKDPSVIIKTLAQKPPIGLIDVYKFSANQIVSVDSIVKTECRISDYYTYPNTFKAPNQ